MFLVYFGRRLYGMVHASAGAFVATQFFHFYYLPIVPLRSILALGGGRQVAIPLHGPSVLAGYGRIWGPVLVAVAIFMRPQSWPKYQGSWSQAALVAAMLLVSVVAYRAGKLSLDEERRRAVFAEVCGAPVDPRLLAKADPQIAKALRARVAELARGLASSGYREAFDAERDWGRAAIDPTVTNAAFLKAALCLARLERHACEAAIWARLKPSLARPST